MSSPKVSAPRSRDFAQALQIAAREHRSGHFEQALAVYRVVLAQCPTYEEAWIDLSRTLFALRRWPQAWAAYGHRFEAFEGRNTPALVRRTGLAGKPRMTPGGVLPTRLAVVSEGGLGDVILFSRFVSRLAERGVQPHLIAPRPLIPLLRTLDPAPSLAPDDAPDAGADCGAWAPLMDLPALLQLAEPELRATKPYLRAEPARVERWRGWLNAALGGKRGPLIAIAWRGGADNRAAAQRCMSLLDLAPLAAIPGVTLVCLQKDASDDEIRASGFAGQILRPGPSFDEDGAFLDSAALLTLVDRLVTIDTALVHLAGALSRPCELLLDADSDWRWLDMAPDNVWHASVRVWRCGPVESAAELVARCVRDGGGAPHALSSVA